MESGKFTPLQLAAAYKAACMGELQALKPGNVHAFADGHGMTVQDFILSADVTAEIITRAGLTPGERIFLAAEATKKAVGQNTNLGVLLLCAPIIEAAMHVSASQSLAQCLNQALSALTVSDAEYVSKAIVLASPAGLGTADQHDVHEKPHVSLLEMMRSAQDRDRISWQYANSFQDIMAFGITRYTDALIKWGNPAWSATALYLSFLAHYPDTHVVRKYGAAFAESLMQEASVFEQLHLAAENPKLVQKKLLDWDASLKQRGINPGTSADLTVATLLVSELL
ncbi:triphosphoribosyl-dephospho-CoA synthase [Methylotenera sp. G11]|uniref:triphosphoribosyl-dephospho-CoA synthase n=1 Tax=Methylotenera sp. G11 TaxID=1506585 RepID=UPI000647419E|nr:triphosphoribosyl-dephospho-CoA synthase [Methylotenera sp. G11]